MDLKAIYDEIVSNINEIDVQLDSLVDTESAGKRKIGNDLVDKFEAQWTSIVEQLTGHLNSLDEETQAGVYLGLSRSLQSVFSEPAKNFVESLAKNAPKSEPLITEEQAAELSKVRSELYQKAKAVVDLAKNFDGTDFEMPKTRRGSRGKRGPRALSLMVWAINGAAVAEEDNSVAGVAKLLGFEKSKDFTQALRDAGVDTREPGDSFEVEINGKTVFAERGEEDDATGDEIYDDAE